MIRLSIPTSIKMRLARKSYLCPLPTNRDELNSQALMLREELSAPLVLISQAPRSGGTLLSQLVDGHTALRAHPHELKIGKPHKSIWPEVMPDWGKRRCFSSLVEKINYELSARGYAKGSGAQKRHRFFFDIGLQQKIFFAAWQERPPIDQRAILNHYFTSYFGAWLNYRVGAAPANYITAFAAGLALNPESVDRFFKAYPDGYLVSILRDPAGWYASARSFSACKGRFDTVELAVTAWIKNAETMKANKQRYGERVILLDFADLVGRTEETMRYLASRLGIDFAPVLTYPTFNGEAIASNTSFSGGDGEIDGQSIVRGQIIGMQERDALLARTLPLHDEVMAHVERPDASKGGLGLTACSP